MYALSAVLKGNRNPVKILFCLLHFLGRLTINHHHYKKLFRVCEPWLWPTSWGGKPNLTCSCKESLPFPTKEVKRGRSENDNRRIPPVRNSSARPHLTSHLLGQDTGRWNESNTEKWNIQQPKAFCLFWKSKSRRVPEEFVLVCATVCVLVSTQINSVCLV